jgi:hypothetical protein
MKEEGRRADGGKNIHRNTSATYTNEACFGIDKSEMDC